jgi:thioredoxin-dependent peroxiredoxin
MKQQAQHVQVLNNQNGDAVTLSSYSGKSPVVLFFYPKAGTPGCTAEACAFRDAFERFEKAGAKVR